MWVRGRINVMNNDQITVLNKHTQGMKGTCLLLCFVRADQIYLTR